MTVLHRAPSETKTPMREALPPAQVPSPLRSLATALILVLVVVAAVFVSLLLIEEEPVEIHDSWMNVPVAGVQPAPAPPVEVHDSWMNVSGVQDPWLSDWSSGF